MRDAHDLSQDDTSVEITPLSAEDELPEAQNLTTGKVSQNAAQNGRTITSATWRFLLIALTACLAMVLFLVAIVIPRSQLPEPSAHPSSIVAAPTLTASVTPYVPTDYGVNTKIVNGVVYAAAANGGMYALRARDGGLIWYQKIDSGAVTEPLVSEGIVYIVANISDVGPGTLYAFRASDGMKVWRYTSSDSLSTPLLDNGIVYVTSYDEVSQKGGLFALRAADGTQLWHKTTRGFWYNTLSVDNQVVYVSANADNGSSSVYALEASDGTQLWLKTTTTFTSISLVANGIAYLLSDREFSAVSARNGQLLWRVPIEGSSGLPPQVIDGVLYLTTTTISLEDSGTPISQGNILPQVGTFVNVLQGFVQRVTVKHTVPLKQGISSVYAVRISDGAVLWHYTLNKENGNNWANWLSIEDGTVYIGTYVDRDKSYIYALQSASGSLVWRQAVDKGMAVNAFATKGVIYNASFIDDGSVNAGSGAVYAIRGSDGSRLWYHSMYWVAYEPPVLVDSTIFVSTAGGDVYAFQASNGSLLWHFHIYIQ